MDADKLPELLKRHEAFWKGEGDAPLKQVTTHTPLTSQQGIPLADGSRVAEGASIAPEQIDPARFYGEASGPDAAVRGDFITGAAPPHLCWTEAILGCPVRVVTGGPWAEPFAIAWNQPNELCPDARWLEKLDAFVDALVERAAGRYPIVQPLMRGPVDMMASALGHEQMCLALLQAPAAADAFLELCADIFIQTAQNQLERTPD